MAKTQSTKIPGIRYTEHPTRKHGQRKDRYFTIRYQRNKKQIEECLGWASEGWTLQKANELLCKIKENIRFGRTPQSFKEMREMNEKIRTEEKKIEQENLADRITIKEVYEQFMIVYKTETADATYKRVRGLYENYIDSKLGNKKLKDVTVTDVQNIILEVSETMASRSVNYVRSVIQLIFNYAKKHDLYPYDSPTAKVKIKQEDNKRRRFLTKDEAKRLLEDLKKRSIDVHDEALLSIYSGMRAGEIFNLQWERVLWHIDRIFIVKTKNGEDRMEPMHPLVKEMLKRRYLDSQTGYVFKSRNGGKIKEVSDTFERAVKALGFNNGVIDDREKIVFHSLRHTYASWLVMKGVDLYTTQKLMGHKSTQTTQRYAHLAPGYLEKAVNSLESI